MEQIETDTALLIKNAERFAELSMQLVNDIGNADISPDERVRLLIVAKMVFDAGIKLAR